MIPSPQMEFLGFLVDSTTAGVPKGPKSVFLDTPKVGNFNRLAKQFHSGCLSSPSSLPPFAKLKESECPSVNYKSEVQFSPQAREELIWWRASLMAWNGKALVNGDPDLTIETDASFLGWKAVCNGVRTGGLRTQFERLLHINCLDLMGVAFAVKAFTQHKTQVKVLLLMVSSTPKQYYGTTYSRNPKPPGGPRVAYCCRPLRLETQTRNLPLYSETLGSS